MSSSIEKEIQQLESAFDLKLEAEVMVRRARANSLYLFEQETKQFDATKKAFEESSKEYVDMLLLLGQQKEELKKKIDELKFEAEAI